MIHIAAREKVRAAHALKDLPRIGVDIEDIPLPDGAAKDVWAATLTPRNGERPHITEHCRPQT